MEETELAEFSEDYLVLYTINVFLIDISFSSSTSFTPFDGLPTPDRKLGMTFQTTCYTFTWVPMFKQTSRTRTALLVRCTAGPKDIIH